MRFLAKLLFHFLNWLRGPVLFVLLLGKGFFFLCLGVGLIALIAIPGPKKIEGEYLAIATAGSLVCYAVGRGYDRALYRLGMEASR